MSAPTILQTTGLIAPSTPQTAATLTLPAWPAATTTGNRVAVVLGITNNAVDGITATVSDGTSYSESLNARRQSAGHDAETLYVFQRLNITGGTARPVITFTGLPAGGVYVTAVAYEVAASHLSVESDITPVPFVGAASAFSVGPAGPSVRGDVLWLAGVATPNIQAVTINAGNPFSQVTAGAGGGLNTSYVGQYGREGGGGYMNWLAVDPLNTGHYAGVGDVWGARATETSGNSWHGNNQGMEGSFDTGRAVWFSRRPATSGVKFFGFGAMHASDGAGYLAWSALGDGVLHHIDDTNGFGQTGYGGGGAGSGPNGEGRRPVGDLIVSDYQSGPDAEYIYTITALGLFRYVNAGASAANIGTATLMKGTASFPGSSYFAGMCLIDSNHLVVVQYDHSGAGTLGTSAVYMVTSSSGNLGTAAAGNITATALTVPVDHVYEIHGGKDGHFYAACGFDGVYEVALSGGTALTWTSIASLDNEVASVDADSARNIWVAQCGAAGDFSNAANMTAGHGWAKIPRSGGSWGAVQYMTSRASGTMFQDGDGVTATGPTFYLWGNGPDFNAAGFDACCIRVDPNDDTRIVSAGRGGSWMTRNGGTNIYPDMIGLNGSETNNVRANGTVVSADDVDWTGKNSNNTFLNVTRGSYSSAGNGTAVSGATTLTGADGATYVYRPAGGGTAARLTRNGVDIADDSFRWAVPNANSLAVDTAGNVYFAQFSGVFVQRAPGNVAGAGGPTRSHLLAAVKPQTSVGSATMDVSVSGGFTRQYAAGLVAIPGTSSSSGGGGGSGGGAPRSFPLAPPDTTGYTVLTDPNPAVLWKPTLTNGVNYVLDCPVQRTHGIQVIGGGNVVIPKLLIKLSQKVSEIIRYGGGDADRILHIDTFDLDPNGFECDAIQTSSPCSGRHIQLRTGFIRKLIGSTPTVHADLLQSSGGIGEVWVQDVEAVTTYQGFQLQREAKLGPGTVKAASGWTRSGSTLTITATGHGLTAGQYVSHSGFSDLQVNGGHTVVTATTNTYTVTLAINPTATSGGAGTVQQMSFGYDVGPWHCLRYHMVGDVNTSGNPPAALGAFRIGARTAPVNNSHPNEDGTRITDDAWNGSADWTDVYIEPPGGTAAGAFVEPDTGSTTWSVVKPVLDTGPTPNEITYPNWSKVAGTVFVGAPASPFVVYQNGIPVSSTTSGTVVTPAPSNTGLPTITPADPQAGTLLNWTVGSWDNVDNATTYTVAIQRRLGTSGTYTTVQTTTQTGPAAGTYQTSPATDAGYQFRVSIIADNGSPGSAANSLPTNVLLEHSPITITVIVE